MDPQIEQAQQAKIGARSYAAQDVAADSPQSPDAAMREGLILQRDEYMQQAYANAVEHERSVRMARAANAALQQLELIDPEQDIDFAPRDANEVYGSAVVGASGRLGGPGPEEGPRP